MENLESRSMYTKERDAGLRAPRGRGCGPWAGAAGRGRGCTLWAGLRAMGGAAPWEGLRLWAGLRAVGGAAWLQAGGRAMRCACYDNELEEAQ